MKISHNQFLKLIWKDAPKDYTMKQIKIIVDLIPEIITKELMKGNTISYTGFGNFVSTYRPSRRAYRPDLEAFFETRPTMVPTFKFRRDLRKKIMDVCSEKVRNKDIVL